MACSERLLGFDARLIDRGEPWDPRMRQLFLLRSDVDFPLSVDTMIWPSLFEETGQGRGAGLPRPEWIGVNDLWSDLAELRAQLDRLGGSQALPAHAIIAASWWSEVGFTLPGPQYDSDSPIEPSSPAPSWTRLGFDVSDPYLLSGLSNCGYTPEESAELAPAYGPELNKHHLFADLDVAFAFRSVNDVRVPSHSPFFVCGLYEIHRVSTPNAPGSEPSWSHMSWSSVECPIPQR